MAQTLTRTQILLEPEQHRTLQEIARLEKRSVSDIAREMLKAPAGHPETTGAGCGSQGAGG